MMAGDNINKLVLNGNTEFDITGDTVTPETLVLGASAHDRSGAAITGTADFSIAGTAAGTTIVITDAADATVQSVRIKGRSEIVGGEIVSVGDNGLTVTASDSGNTDCTSAAITTGLPLRSYSECVYDELDSAKGVVTKRCTVGNDGVEALAEPVELPLGSAEITALNGLRTYDSFTGIEATDSPEMTIGYLLNNDNGQAVANLEKKYGSGHSATLILSRSGGCTLNTAYTFLNGAKLTDFDAIEVLINTPGGAPNAVFTHMVLDAEVLGAYPKVNWQGWNRRAMDFTFTSTSVTVTRSVAENESDNYKPNIYYIYGIKH